MNLDRYPYYATNSVNEFEFISIGSKGDIKKLVKFSEIGEAMYNFSFSDLDEITGIPDDSSISNNGDRDKILATLASIIFNFTQGRSDIVVYIIGNTASRTRLYEINISKY